MTWTPPSSIGAAPIDAGGTGSTSVISIPTATSWAGWDGNANFSANNFLAGLDFIVSAAGTTSLIASSDQTQIVTGTDIQTVEMPDVTTLMLGQPYRVVNKSTGDVTINSSGGDLIQTMESDSAIYLICQSITGSTSASWVWFYNPTAPFDFPLAPSLGGTGIANTDADTLTITGVSVINQDVSSTASPEFASLTVSGEAEINSISFGRGRQNIISNMVMGNNAFVSNTSSNGNNTIIGYDAVGETAVIGPGNTIIGSLALTDNDYDGSYSTVVGYLTGFNLDAGSGQNTFFGYSTGYTGATGAASVTTGANNTFIGYRASGNDEAISGAISLGADAVALIATGNTSSDNGPGISIGSSAFPVGFRGDGSIYPSDSGAGFWRTIINGTAYFMPLYSDSSITTGAVLLNPAAAQTISTYGLTVPSLTTANLSFDVTANTILSTGTDANINIAPNGYGFTNIGTSTANPFQALLGVLKGGIAASVFIGSYINNGSTSTLYFTKSRSTSIGSFTAVQSGDPIGNAVFYADDGAALTQCASIKVTANGTISSGIVPTQMILATANTSGAVTVALTISNAQVVTLANALPVGSGGTGIATTTAYGIIAGGTTSTGAFQNVGTGTSGQLLQSGGASALPTWTTATFPSGSGTLNHLLRSDGTNWVQTTATTLTSADALAGLASVTTANLSFDVTANTIKSTGTNANINIIPSGSGTTILGGNYATFSGQLWEGSAISTSASCALTTYWAADAGATIALAASASTTPGSLVAVSNGRILSQINTFGDDGVTGFVAAGTIQYNVSGSVSSGIVPTQMTIATANTSGTRVVGFTMSNAQVVTLANALPVASGGTGITSFGTGVATALGQNVTGSGGIVLKTNPTISSPFIDQVVDSANEIILSFYSPNPGASPNSIGLFNATTGTSPEFLSQGSDTNVGMQFTAQAAGIFVYQTTATSNQWIVNTGAALQHTTTWSYPSSSASRTITVPDASGTLAFTGSSVETINGDSGSVTPSSGTVTISGGSTGLTTSGSSSTLNLTGVLALANGGTNANLTASNGGIFYSTASAGAILAGTSTANQILMSGSSTTPAWSTATYPATVTSGNILYASGSNVIGQITSGTGVVTALAVNVGSAGAFVTFNGALGTPSSGTLTSCTGLPVSTGILGLGTGVATALAAGVSGSGDIVLVTSATMISPTLGAASATSLTMTNSIAPSSNAQTLSAGLTLTSTSAQYQFLNTNGANRTVTLPTAATNMLFIISNVAADGFVLNVVTSASAAVVSIANNVTIGVYYDGAAWILV